MKPAIWPRERPEQTRLLVVDAARMTLEDSSVAELPHFFGEGDLLVVNDAATLPASLSGDGLEVRLCGREPDGRFRAVLFGAGDWRTPTEQRPAPPLLREGDPIALGRLRARVTNVDPVSPRLVYLRFECDEATLWRALYAGGRPIQYAHLRDALPLWEIQTGYAARPWAAEMPSAGRPLTWQVLLEARRRGARLAALTHAAGVSSTGDPVLDARLPLDETAEIPETTAAAIARARRVIAVGTTVVRALEGTRATPGRHRVDLVIGPGFEPQVAAGLLTGIHEAGSSHRALVGAFAPRSLLRLAYLHAEASGYLGHEFGDSMLLFSRGRNRGAGPRPA